MTLIADAPAARPPRLQDEIGKKTPFECLEQEVTLNLERTADELGRPFAELFEAHGLSCPQYNVLRILRGHGRPVPCHEIGAQMICRTPDVTRLVDRLESAGLAERRRTPDDRRVVFIVITKAGLKLLARLDRPVIDMHRKALAHLSQPEMKTLNRLLVKMRHPRAGH
jgi:DNA-binding MarR family transcriptional regulator